MWDWKERVDYWGVIVDEWLVEFGVIWLFVKVMKYFISVVISLQF